MADRQTNETRASLMDYVEANDGRLPEPLRGAVNRSCREAFLRLRERLGRRAES